LSIYLHGVDFGFRLYFYTNFISFVFNHISISTFIGFHGLNIPLYSVIFYVILSRIPLTQSHVVSAKNGTICWLLLSCYQYLANPGLDIPWFPTKPSKTIAPPRKPKGNTIHRVHCAVSPEIVLWVAATLRCLQPRNEWGFRIESCDIYLYTITSIYAKYYISFIHACKIVRSSYFIKHSSKI
jgi:hypothetical protein